VTDFANPEKHDGDIFVDAVSEDLRGGGPSPCSEQKLADYFEQLGDDLCVEGEFEEALQPYYNVYKLTRKRLNESRYTKYDAVKKTLALFYDTQVNEPGAWIVDEGGIELDKVFTYKMVFDKLNETPLKESALKAFATMMVAVSSDTVETAPFMRHICTALTYFKKQAKVFGDKVKPVATKLFKIMLERNKRAVMAQEKAQNDEAQNDQEEDDEEEDDEEDDDQDDQEGGGYVDDVTEAVGNYAANAAERFTKAFGPFDLLNVYQHLEIDILVDTLVKSLTTPPIVAIYSALNAAGIKVETGDMDELENLEVSLEAESHVRDALKNLANVKAAVWPGKIEAPGFGAAMYPSAITSLFTKEPKLTESSTVYCIVNMSLTPYSDLDRLSEFYKKYQADSPLTCDERTREIDLLTKLKFPSLHKAAENLRHQAPGVRGEVVHQRVARGYSE
jgi:hypothetical protein